MMDAKRWKRPTRRWPQVWLLVTGALAQAGCRDVSSFTNTGDRYQGTVVAADFVLAGIDPGTELCLTIDANHLQDAPGAISTSDGRFQSSAMRPVPQLWHDPLSTLTFGEGRVQNLLYFTAAATPYGDLGGNDVLTIVSLMQSGDVEVRLLRGAPGLVADAGAAGSGPTNVFAVFPLTRQPGPCSF